MKSKKVSIIVPVFNAERYIGKCIDSLLGQDYSDLEIILVDDGSTDSSLDICKSYEKRKNNIVVISQVNSGPSAARNLGIERSSGDYVFFCDADDYIDSSAISSLVKNFSSGSLVGLNYQIVKKRRMVNKTYSKSCYRKDEFLRCIFQGKVMGRVGCFLFDKDRIADLVFDKNTNYMEDTLFLVEYLMNEDIKCVNFVEGPPYYYYSDNPNSITAEVGDPLKKIGGYLYSLDRINKITGGRFEKQIENDKIKIVEHELKLGRDLSKTDIEQIPLGFYNGLDLKFLCFSILVKIRNVKMIEEYYRAKSGIKKLIRGKRSRK